MFLSQIKLVSSLKAIFYVRKYILSPNVLISDNFAFSKMTFNFVVKTNHFVTKNIIISKKYNCDRIQI